MVTIRAEHARRLGLPTDKLKFSMRVATANGTSFVGATTIDTLIIRSITQFDVPAFVASPGTLSEKLLGQSFLRKL